MKKERIIIEVSHEDGEVYELESWVEGEKMVDGDDIVEDFAHLTAILATHAGHLISVMTDNVNSAIFGAGKFAEMVVEQIRGEFEEEDEYV